MARVKLSSRFSIPPLLPPPHDANLNFTACRLPLCLMHPVAARSPPARSLAKQKAARAAVCWLRTAKRTASKRAITVALAVTLAFPSLNAPRFSGEGVAAGGGSRSGAGTPAVELVLPSGTAAAEQATTKVAVEVRQEGGERVFNAQRGGFGTGPAAASKEAFVRPWGEEVGVRPKGVVAAAVRAPSRGGKKSRLEPVKETPTAALRSLVNTVGENGLEIAEEFSGHIQVGWVGYRLVGLLVERFGRFDKIFWFIDRFSFSFLLSVYPPVVRV